MNPQIIAFYLPQYHPIEENNRWYGKGFTEWTNVAKAKPLFKGHIQPRVPADLGFYDLRIPEVREEQAKMAKEAGITAFCYYHYWFGNGKMLLEKPAEEMLRSKQPDFPFCFCWANHSWLKKNWNANTGILDKTMLQEQLYPGDEDIKAHFAYLLPFFKDERYYKIEGRPVFVLYVLKDIPDPLYLMKVWNELAMQNGLPGICFISYTDKKEELKKEPFIHTDGIILSLLNSVVKSNSSKKSDLIKLRIKKLLSSWLKIPLLLYDYKDAIKCFLDPMEEEENIIPEIIPNWDYTPRQGAGNLILKNSTPSLFEQHVSKALELIKNKPENKQIIFLKSWNEWGEGNYMEPDMTWSRGYLNALRNAINQYKEA